VNPGDNRTPTEIAHNPFLAYVYTLPLWMHSPARPGNWSLWWFRDPYSRAAFARAFCDLGYTVVTEAPQ
jgi:hypothetical protein